ncbi:galactosylgalactosylxylosylprotein 3-beta-glucuronosyltransferase I [Anabrus simplex]|uniref:galactosylgalactosylxylosylprotein 3-beta-glucuronosyltransferase I n=1 Tax=Anabrus simplex TaxID=316456 RepID=UPI0035A322B4
MSSDSSGNAALPCQDMRRRYRKKLFVIVIFSLVAGMVYWLYQYDHRIDTSADDLLKEALLECYKTKPQIRGQLHSDGPTIYAITPTYSRPVQKAELTRLSHTFMLVPDFHWIIVEDAPSPTSLVTKLLLRSGIPHTQLVAATPKKWKLKEKDANWKYPRGVIQRNRALEWLRENLDANRDKGVVYFADDDNAYSLEIFEEMRSTKGVSVWPVGLVGGLMVEKPLLNATTGRVAGWNSAWKPERPFPIDMAGFAINLELLLHHPEAKFSFDVEGGYQESEILRHITTRDKLEPKADKCTKVYVWHTRTEPPKLNQEQLLQKKGKRSDEGMEV